MHAAKMSYTWGEVRGRMWGICGHQSADRDGPLNGQENVGQPQRILMGKSFSGVIGHAFRSRYSVQQVIAVLIVSRLQGMYA